MWIYLNDRFVQDHEAAISVFVHGFLYGDGVFETMRSYGPRLFMRDRHLSRLFQSADAIGMRIPIPLRQWAAILQEAMEFPSHVGIYLGDNLFIHASSKGRRVTVDSLDTPYYLRRFIGANRLLTEETPEIDKES